jgi:argininosuccinate lyase
MHEDVVRRGRLSGERSEELKSFLSSMEADKNIAKEDIIVDIAHLLMLDRQKIIAQDHAKALMKALLVLYHKGIPGAAFDDRFEDIHAGIESLLISSAGEDSGGRLHMGRSRNDEVAACIRLRLRDELLLQMGLLNGLRAVLLDRADEQRESVMPGFTHFQPAQPTTLGHYLLSYEQAFARDFERLSCVYTRVNMSPLGSAAFASTGYPVDRAYTASILGFDGFVLNTMDAVASRDQALEVLADYAILMTTISRLCEELVVWSSPLIGFVALDDSFCSTSSIMPQKKNPDTAEIMRGKSGSVLGDFTAAAVIVKGLPMSYNRDLQELNPHLWRAVRDTSASTGLLSAMLATAVFDRERMKEKAGDGFSTATDLADFFVRTYDMPFRKAHSIVARAVSTGSVTCESLDRAAGEFSEQSLTGRGFTGEQLNQALSVTGSIAARNPPGGPAPEATARAVVGSREKLARDGDLLKSREQAVSRAIERMLDDAGRLVS